MATPIGLRGRQRARARRTDAAGLLLSRPCTVVEVNHPVAEPTLAQQRESQPDIAREPPVSQPLFAAPYNDGRDDQMELVDQASGDGLGHQARAADRRGTYPPADGSR
jgi:hypothetical protein